jgi:hypothetical protein
MKRSKIRNPSRRALGAAVAGILAGAALAIGCGPANEAVATPTEANGCNGPNGCGGESAEPGDAAQHAQAESDANGCNGPNGCNGETQE